MAYRWRHCALTQERLQEPIVMCALGRLYSKQSIIEQLLDKESEMPDACKHIKSLRDVRNLNLTPNPTYNKDADKTEGLLDTRSAPYICKLIGLEMTGKFRFIALWTCGCVFSERALKEIGTNICSLCQTPFTDDDIIILNGTDSEMEEMAEKIEGRALRRKADKKSKKESKKSTNKISSTITSAIDLSSTIKQEPLELASTSREQLQPIVSMKIIKTELIKPDKSKEIKAGTSTLKNSQKLAKRPGTKEALMDPALKKLKDDSLSVANDPKASAVYKSLFTSHESAELQDRAHWVTYNPFYN